MTTPPLPGRRVLINPQEMTPNPAVPEAVWEALLALPSQALPQRGARPVKRLTALAHELAADGLLADAGKRPTRKCTGCWMRPGRVMPRRSPPRVSRC